MTNVVIEELEAVVAKIKAEFAPAVKVAENDAHGVVSAAWTYIKTNGLTDLYNIALSIVGGAVAGAPWAGTLASIVSQAETDGVQIIKGAEAVVAAQAQADLIVAGKLLPPVPAA